MCPAAIAPAFTLRENTLKRADLDDFVNCYFGGTSSVSSGTDRAAPSKSRHDRKETDRFNPDKSGANRFERVESERFRGFTHEELIKRDKRSITRRTFPASLDTLKVSVPPAVKLAPCQRYPSTS